MKLLVIGAILIFVLCTAFLGCHSATSSNVDTPPSSPTSSNVNTPPSSPSIANSNTGTVVNNQPHLISKIPDQPAAATPPVNQVTPAAQVSGNNTSQAKTTKNSSAAMESFNKIQNDMTYPEVAKILGSAGEKSGEFKVEGGVLTEYKWQGKESGRDFIVGAEFINGKLVRKTQFGLN